MANVAHKNLTGTDLHEPKGVAAAAANKVYVSDGAGSGSWAKLTADQLQTTGNPFGGQLFHVQDQKSSGTAGGTFTSGAWRTRTLNTEVTNEITSASLVSNQITLPAGTYFIDARLPAYAVSSQRGKLKNVTDGTDVLFGSTAYNTSTLGYSFIRGRFTIAGSKVFELQHYCTTTASTSGFGIASSLGTEIYADALIWKVA